MKAAFCEILHKQQMKMNTVHVKRETNDNAAEKRKQSEHKAKQ
jgi:hypothetical protein